MQVLMLCLLAHWKGSTVLLHLLAYVNIAALIMVCCSLKNLYSIDSNCVIVLLS